MTTINSRTPPHNQPDSEPTPQRHAAEPTGIDSPWEGHRLDPDRLAAGLLAREGDWQRTAENLAASGSAVVPTLRELLRCPDTLLRVRLAWLLGRRPETEALDLLEQLLMDPQPPVRRQVVEALGERMSTTVEERARLLAERAMRDADNGVRQSAAGVLRAHPDIRSLDVLREAVEDRSPGVRVEVAAALGGLRDPRALPQLTKLLSDHVSQVRWTAVEGLGRIPCRESVAALMASMRSTDALLSQKAGVALVRVGALAAAPLGELLSVEDGDLRSRAWIILAGIGAPAVPTLCNALEQAQPHTRRAAAQALAHIARHDPSPELQRALPRLRKLCSPWGLEGPESIAAYRAAISHIEKATERLKHLPLPSSAPPLSPHDLPVAAQSGEPGGEKLPLPVRGFSGDAPGKPSAKE